ncbi:WNT1-inducible-signaling pathway protein 2 [Conger conger]|uniref:WNT1-inducible-signaling pathway protein 2 n=1 Tax=Conger conger TaxID=82655 RepID=UPI002A5A6180|nr:WNT1-inducible-signaling pathway protein 2 [Conger conger]
MNSAGSFSNSTANRSTDFLQEKQVASLVQMERVGDRVSVCFLLLCTLSRVLCQQCGGPCSCPLPAPRCPVGVPLVLDGCRCCRVCAGQLGEACSERLVCDGWRGLRCDHSAGECVGQSGLGCELNGVTYQEGQVFQPSCTLRCQCEGGGVTCTRLCADDLKLPTPDCPNPRHVQLPGKCCREWVCKDAENSVLHDAMAAYSLEMMDQNQDCIEHSTEWGACSQSCGPGVSVRVSNRNRACRLETQTRLCQVRPCHALSRRTPTTPGRCEPSYRVGVPVRLELWDCVSVRAYRPRYCGHCSDGRCCSPGRSHTVPVAFRCPRGHLLYYPVMAIESCACHYNCPHVVTRGPMRPF